MPNMDGQQKSPMMMTMLTEHMVSAYVRTHCPYCGAEERAPGCGHHWPKGEGLSSAEARKLGDQRFFRAMFTGRAETGRSYEGTFLFMVRRHEGMATLYAHAERYARHEPLRSPADTILSLSVDLAMMPKDGEAYYYTPPPASPPVAKAQTVIART
jgi:hypothetical protein